MEFKAKAKLLRDAQRATQYEWLEANGLGGWAGSTICGIHTRRYHGLLVAACEPPANRKLMLSRLDEVLHFGPLQFALGCSQFPGIISPQGHWRLHSFTHDIFPEYEYKIGDVSLKKTVAAVHDENTTLVLYEISGNQEPFSFELEPLVAARDFHSLAIANDAINRAIEFVDGVLCVHPYEGCPKLYISVPGSTFEKRPAWSRHFQYQKERERGLDFEEDLFSYGRFRLSLENNCKLGVIISTEPAAGRSAFHLFETEKKRRLTLAAKLPVQDEFAQSLALAADVFVVKRGQKGRTIIAGYPWFLDWGRDAMVALTGLTLTSGRPDDARLILTTFRDALKDGLIPNCFAEGRSTPAAYNSADATLWLFIAVNSFLAYTKDYGFVRTQLLDCLVQIISRFRKGTKFKIGVDQAGLLSAGDESTQLTWMDAKCEGQAVTPRHGKAVEINALWYNALMITAAIFQQLGLESEAAEYRQAAGQTKQAFSSDFWLEQKGYLCDWVTEDTRDETLRPNQLLALSLPYPLLPAEQALKVIASVEEGLMTPFGPRTLGRSQPNYRGTYEGNGEERNRAYHQGPVWPWLCGSYATAVMRFGTQAQRTRLKATFDTLKYHLLEAGLGSISELFDGDNPHTPRGCPFQAWSVAEVLRAYVEDYCGIKP
jgi:predicted glycogen debranching enzyme